jgi:DNA-binding CsgD family transcriptional regulator
MNEPLIELIYESAFVPVGRDKDIILGLERENARGPVERTTLDRLNELHPHLVRSSLIASRLGLVRAGLMADTLASLGLPALVVNDQGRVLAANELIEAQAQFVRWLTTDRIGLRDRKASDSLRQALKRLCNSAAVDRHSFPARSQDGADLAVVHVVPVKGMARDVFGDAAAMIVLLPLKRPKAPSISLIQSMFGLSQSEARIAQGLAVGATLDELAAQGNVSRNTVRSQLRVVLEKTGCSRQAEVATLLSRLAW